MDATIFLYAFCATAVVGGAYLLLARNPIHGAMGLLTTMLSLAGIYAALQAHLLAVLQVLIYAGAIIVLIVYIIMLLDTKSDDARAFNARHVSAAVALAALFVAMMWAGVQAVERTPFASIPESYGTVRAVAHQLLGPYVFAFELAGVLLLAGIIGTVYLTTAQGGER